ncbi:TPA: RHS repeat-associated core domain-containing protein [Pseudomonas putida]|uniref:RHS repeat-associated core domain-containing protein n=1 Tax=Pseudomonas putida TaxID=303 RepID=UPI002363E1C6|nr:RHS repeat-associated core domain-containing protein [Pseudomonas putida]MDD2149140.1 RHS repeat-associated core domain-containing protein [Pseudomonas putida]HDS1681412.1 RHS repeat-associated core domain-containing protein [Pseudomonas putida]
MSNYAPYGWRTVTQHSTLAFNGELFDDRLGGYSLGNGRRLYNPRLMRFCIPDSLSPFHMGGINSYAYCQGDPINFTDPSGHAPSIPTTHSNRKVPSLLQQTSVKVSLKKINKLSEPLRGNAIKARKEQHELMTDDLKRIFKGEKPLMYSLAQLETYRDWPGRESMTRHSAFDASLRFTSNHFDGTVIKRDRDLLIKAGIENATEDQKNQAMLALHNIREKIRPSDPVALQLFYAGVVLKYRKKKPFFNDNPDLKNEAKRYLRQKGIMPQK